VAGPGIAVRAKWLVDSSDVAVPMVGLYALRALMRQRRYYNQRIAGEPAGLSLAQVRKIVGDMFTDMEDAGYFQENFGKDCVDNGLEYGSAGRDISAYIYRRTRLENVWPFRASCGSLDEVELFTMLEFLWDHASKGLSGRNHDFGGCGMHYETFNKKAGQDKWRIEVNEILIEYGDGFEMTASGEIRQLGPAGLRDILNSALPVNASVDDVVQKVDLAVQKFRSGRSTWPDRKDAVRELADVLELIRPRAKAHLLTEDERALFNLANNYGIRHHNEAQKKNYDKVTWLTWMFYVYLSTIHLLLRLPDGKNAGSAPR
jgi:hypothetical protein